MDHEYCYPGCTVTLAFRPTDDTPAAFTETCVYDYVVQKGDNNLGRIDLGLYGFTLDTPEDGEEIWPEGQLEFIWSAYERSGITPGYTLNLQFGYLGTIEKTTQNTSLEIASDEMLDEEYGLGNVDKWMVYIEYQEKGHTIRHYSEKRDIDIKFPAT